MNTILEQARQLISRYGGIDNIPEGRGGPYLRFSNLLQARISQITKEKTGQGDHHARARLVSVAAEQAAAEFRTIDREVQHG